MKRHDVEVFTERSSFGLPRWEALCSCGWSREVLGLGVDGERLAFQDALKHVGERAGSVWGLWLDDGS